MPSNITEGQGVFIVDGQFGVALQGYTEHTWTAHASAPVQQLGEDGSYKLAVSTTEVKLTAASPIGAMRGLQTFLQLIAVVPSVELLVRATKAE
ncbi:MAG: beta-N-acetylhexosaminidase N-terminal domain-containing protein [Acidobacteriaceae bacterium]